MYCTVITSAHYYKQCSHKNAIALLWLGVQAPTAEVRVVLEVPPEVDEGMHNYFHALSPDHCS